MAGTFMHNIKVGPSAWGLVALIAVDIMAFFSTAFWRRKAYNVFIATHVFGMALLLPAVSSFPLTLP